MIIMENEGIVIPELPVVYIKAKDEADAKEILLKISSQYGKISQKGFEDFIKGLDIDFEDLGMNIRPPNNIREELGKIPEAPATITKLGDIYNIGTHRLICGDCTSAGTYQRLLGAERADLVFTDPPYGVNLGKKNIDMNKAKGKNYSLMNNIEGDNMEGDNMESFLNQAFILMKDYLKDDAAFYITAPQGVNLRIFMNSLQKAEIPVKHQLIWCKNSCNFSIERLDYEYQHETILYGWKKTHKFYGMGKYQTSLWHYEKPLKANLHPTMKPVALIKNAIENSMEPLEKAENALLNSTVKNNIILDIFAGSGSTLIAAHDCRRQARLIEIDLYYCDVIVRRAMEAFPNLKVTREREGHTQDIKVEDFS